MHKHRNMHIFFYEKAVCRMTPMTEKGKIMEKSLLVMLAFLFKSRVGDNISTVQIIEPKEDENGFLRLSYDNPTDMLIL